MRLAVLISGSGTTLQNLLDQIRAGGLAAEVVGVVSSRPDVLGVKRATDAGVPVTVVERKPVGSRIEDRGSSDPPHSSLLTPHSFSDRVFQAVRPLNADLVCLAGWLHLLRIPADFRHRVLNIHPSLLPAFGGRGMYGRHVHEAVLEYGAKVSGCTVHFADDTYDTGSIVVQRAVPVLPTDTPDTLAARVFAAECEAYPDAIRRLAGGYRVDGRRVVFER